MVSLEVVVAVVAVVAPSVAVTLVLVLQPQPRIQKNRGLYLSKKSFEEVFYSVPNPMPKFGVFQSFQLLVSF